MISYWKNGQLFEWRTCMGVKVRWIYFFQRGITEIVCLFLFCVSIYYIGITNNFLKCCCRECSVITLVLSFVSFLLSAIATDGCQFIKIQEKATVNLRYIGMFSYFVEEKGCKVLVFANGKVPGAVRAAQAFGVMTPLVAGTALLVCMSQIFMRVSLPTFRILGIVYIICFAFQMFTFSLFAIDDCTKARNLQCEPGPDGYVAIMAAFFFVVTSIIMFMMKSTDRSLITTMYVAITMMEGADAVNAPRGGVNSLPPPTTDDPDITDLVQKSVKSFGASQQGTTSVRKTESIDAEGKKTVTKVMEQIQEDGTKKTITETTQPDGTVMVTTHTENV